MRYVNQQFMSTSKLAIEHVVSYQDEIVCYSTEKSEKDSVFCPKFLILGLLKELSSYRLS